MRPQAEIRVKRIRKTALAAAIASVITAQYAGAESKIEEVVVTATKRTANIQDVPISITAVSGDDLVKAQITDILSLEKAIPGLTVANYGNLPRAVIRGAGTAGTSDIAVPIYHNGMYLPSYGQALAGYVDIERIEALRGPQGTLFGRNTYGGLINVITRKPDLDGFDFGAAVTGGDYSLRKVEGFINVPVTDNVAFRLTVADEQRDPFVENVVNGSAGLKDSDYTYVRAQVKVAATDDLTVNISGSYWKDTANGSLNYGYKPAGIPLDRNDLTQINAINGFIDPRFGLYVGCADGDRPGGRSQAGNVCDGDASASVTPGNEFQVNYEYTPNRELEEKALYLNVDWNVANHNVTLNAARFDYTSVSIMDADFSPNAAWIDGDLSQTKSHQLDLIVSSASGSNLQYTFGAYLFDSQDDDNTSQYLFGSLVASWSGYAGATPQTPSWAYWTTEGRGGTKSTAVYGQAEYSFTEKLSGIAGLRYTKDDRRSQGSSSLPFDASQRLGPAFPTYSYAGRPVEQGTDNSTDYRIGLSYAINDSVLVYGSAATAYIAGATDTVTQKLLDPQTNDTIEFGVKSTLLDGSLVLNASLYDAQYEGLNTTQFVTQGTTGVAVAVQVPGGSISSRGAEIEANWYVTSELTVDVGISIEDSNYDKFVVGAGNLVVGGAAPIGSEVIAGEPVFVMDGRPTAYAPDVTMGIGVSYRIDLGDMGVLTPFVNAYYNSGYWTNRAPVFFGEQDAYTKWDLSLGWESKSGDYTASLWINNATDELIQTYTEIYSRARVAYDYQRPMSWGVRFGYNF